MLGWNASQEIGARSFFADIPKEKSAAEKLAALSLFPTIRTLPAQSKSPNATKRHFILLRSLPRIKRERRNKISVLLAFAEPQVVALASRNPETPPPYGNIVSQRAKSVKPHGAVFCTADPKARPP